MDSEPHVQLVRSICHCPVPGADGWMQMDGCSWMDADGWMQCPLGCAAWGKQGPAPLEGTRVEQAMVDVGMLEICFVKSLLKEKIFYTSSDFRSHLTFPEGKGCSPMHFGPKAYLLHSTLSAIFYQFAPSRNEKTCARSHLPPCLLCHFVLHRSDLN